MSANKRIEKVINNKERIAEVDRLELFEYVSSNLDYEKKHENNNLEELAKIRYNLSIPANRGERTIYTKDELEEKIAEMKKFVDDELNKKSNVQESEAQEPAKQNVATNDNLPIDNSYDAETDGVDLRTAMIGQNAVHYIPIFDSIDKDGGTRWNWCGCLFSPYWFAYRKMFGWSAIALFAPAIAGFIIGIAMATANASDSAYNGVSRGIGIVFAIIFGVLANSLYKKRIDKLVREVPQDVTERERFIKVKGGVSALGLIISIVVYVALYVLLGIAAA